MHRPAPGRRSRFTPRLVRDRLRRAPTSSAAASTTTPRPLEDGVLEGSAKVASVDVKDEQLNGHLQTPDFFDAERFPEISFRTSDLETGELTIKGVTRPVTITATSPGAELDPFGRERVGIALEAKSTATSSA